MKITFLGACHMVTGSQYLLEQDNTKLLVDCGMIQGEQFTDDKNYDKFAFDPSGVAAICVTHAHIDHCGRIPRLVREGFQGKVIATLPTLDLAALMLEDSAHVIQLDAEQAGYPPLYTAEDVLATTALFNGVKYHEPVTVGPFNIEFFDAGHVLGSAFIKITAGGKSIIFSGDVGNPPVPLLKPTEPLPQADYMVMESTYGQRAHEPGRERKLLLSSAIYETITMKGTLLIPAFALERTQEILYELNGLVENKEIPPVPIFIDSPLAIKATRIYPKYNDWFNQETQYLLEKGDDVFKFNGLKFTTTSEESRAILHVKAPKVILAGSGMMQGGRVRFHAKNYLPDANNQLLIVGYQVKGSLGRQLLDKAREVTIDGDRVPVHAKVRAIGAYSAHADQPKLVNWVHTMPNKPQHIWLTHGEPENAEILAGVLRRRGQTVSLPEIGQSVEL
ncbi:MAG: MBL fold metallo-hydrolase [Patescibacteria group bacterium]|jgi:metallo-beta-lactamase family protein